MSDDPEPCDLGAAQKRQGSHTTASDEAVPDAVYAERGEPPDALLCDDCGDQVAGTHVQCPIDEDRHLALCEPCYEMRGPGIEICHVSYDDGWDVNGGCAAPAIQGGEKRHLNNTGYPKPGWLGNPYEVGRDGDRQDVLRQYRDDLLRKCRVDGMFVFHLSRLRGKRVVCDEGRTPETACHLDVVHATLMGLYRDE